MILKLDKNKSFITDFSSRSETLLITFGAMGFNQKGIIPFGLLKSTLNLPVKKLYIRDPNRAWYHQGLPEVGRNIDDIVLFLKNKIKQQHAKRVIMMGGSMGGYAALLFGFLVDVDIVHSFNPLTFIDPIPRLLNGDYFSLSWKFIRLRLLIRNVVKSLIFSKKYTDLKKLFISGKVKTEFNIHYSLNSRMDRRHAQRMNIFPNVILHPYNERNHSLKMAIKKEDFFYKNIISSIQFKSTTGKKTS